jgi:hypothetical protein
MALKRCQVHCFKSGMMAGSLMHFGLQKARQEEIGCRKIGLGKEAGFYLRSERGVAVEQAAGIIAGDERRMRGYSQKT